MLMLSLDNAVAVCMRFLHETTYFDDMPIEEYERMSDFIRREFEQKCWSPPETDEAAQRLNDLISDINPAEICSQIRQDNLTDWCYSVQVMMRMSMVQLPGWEKEESNDL